MTEHPAALALAGLLSLVVAIGIGRFVYTPILPYMTAGLGLTKSQAGLLASANYLGYLLGALTVARQAPPGDQRRWLLGALAVSGLSTCAMALTTGLAPFLLLRFANGIAGALAMVLGSSLVMDRLAIAGRAGWASLMYVGVGGGVTISAWAVPAIASQRCRLEKPVAVLRRHRHHAVACCGGAVGAAAGTKCRRSNGRKRFGSTRPRAFRLGLRPLRVRLRHHRNVCLRPGAR